MKVHLRKQIVCHLVTLVCFTHNAMLMVPTNQYSVIIPLVGAGVLMSVLESNWTGEAKT